MKSPQTVTLPIAEGNYTIVNEQTMRRMVEQTFQDLRSDVVTVRDIKDGPSSKAHRRLQFMLMGAP